MSETQRNSIDPKQGAQPKKSIRKRGYNRALKRREVWALIEEGQRTLLNDVNRWIFDPLCNNNTLYMIGLSAIVDCQDFNRKNFENDNKSK